MAPGSYVFRIRQIRLSCRGRYFVATITWVDRHQFRTAIHAKRTITLFEGYEHIRTQNEFC
jgi:hypothetical protein